MTMEVVVVVVVVPWIKTATFSRGLGSTTSPTLCMTQPHVLSSSLSLIARSMADLISYILSIGGNPPPVISQGLV